MFTVYTNTGNGWVFTGNYATIEHAEEVAANLAIIGCKVEISKPNDPVERDFYD